MWCWLKTLELEIISHLSLHHYSIADAEAISNSSREHGDTGDDASPDVQHAVNGDPIYPALLAAATVPRPPLPIRQDNLAEDDEYTGYVILRSWWVTY